MREFFRGWRRNAGLVTLAMALALMAVWMRSFVVCDSVYTAKGKFTCGLVSSSGQLHWYKTAKVDGRNLQVDLRTMWLSFPIRPDPDGFDDRFRFDDRVFTWGGFEFYDLPLARSAHTVGGAIPYWSLVLPLTLLSAWLILAKPRKAKGVP